MSTASAVKILDTLGRKRVADALGVKMNAVHMAASDRMPGFWYRPIAELCEAEGIECPLDAFRWKGDQPESAA